MDRLWVIAAKEVRTRFTDRRLLLIMLAAPLAISTIIGLAFGGLGRSTSPIQHIAVAVINRDQPGASGFSFGAELNGLLVEGKLPANMSSSPTACPQKPTQTDNSAGSSLSLGDLIQGTAFDSAETQRLIDEKSIPAPAGEAGSAQYVEAAARAAVDKGLYAALVIIPTDFSSALSTLSDPRQAPARTTVTVYGNAGQSLAAGIVRSVVDGITSQLVSGNIAIGATFAELAERQPSALASASKLDMGSLFQCAFVPGNDLVRLDDTPVQAAPTDTAGALLVSFGAAEALFFALFTGQWGVLSMYDERRNWTLQRMIASPTPRWAILGGKLVGVLVSVVFQLTALIVALTAVGSLIEGRIVFIWGTDLPKLIIVILAVAACVSGLGMFLAGVLKSVEQANVVSSVLNIGLGVLGGAFGFQLPSQVSAFSLIYWGRQAFEILASGRGEVWLNVIVLLAEGAAMFVIGLFLFNRRFEA